MKAVWKQIEARWPAQINGAQSPYFGLKNAMGVFLDEHRIDCLVLSHFGIVVKNIEHSLVALTELIGRNFQPNRRDWVESCGVHVARGDLDGIEIEFIEPVKESFFSDFLHTYSEGLHHLSFQIDHIHDCVERLVANGVPMVDRRVREGSHGWIVFVRPAEFSPLCLELCQSHEDSSSSGQA